MLDNVLLLTIIFIIVSTIISTFISSRKRDRCLTSFSDFMVTLLEKDGKNLMATVFNEDKPIIKINELLNKSDRDEQEGFKFLFMGGQVGIRNPKAHDNVVQTDPYRIIEYLGLASLLMRRIEEGKLVKLLR